jgi:group I intron endonuclease
MIIISGIYEIVNKENGKKYIGSSSNLKKRKSDHFSLLRRKKHKNPHLQHSWNKYGEDCFDFIILEICAGDKKTLENREQYYLDMLNPEFNICVTAGNQTGMKRSKESRNKMSKSHIGISVNKGRKHTLESRKNMSLAHKGHINSPEARMKISIANTGKKGVIHTQETKDRLAETSHEYWERVKRNEIERDTNTVGAVGNKIWLGRKHNQEAKDKVSAARKAYWAKKKQATNSQAQEFGNITGAAGGVPVV